MTPPATPPRHHRRGAPRRPHDDPSASGRSGLPGSPARVPSHAQRKSSRTDSGKRTADSSEASGASADRGQLRCERSERPPAAQPLPATPRTRHEPRSRPRPTDSGKRTADSSTERAPPCRAASPRLSANAARTAKPTPPHGKRKADGGQLDGASAPLPRSLSPPLRERGMNRKADPAPRTAESGPRKAPKRAERARKRAPGSPRAQRSSSSGGASSRSPSHVRPKRTSAATRRIQPATWSTVASAFSAKPSVMAVAQGSSGE